MDGLGLVTIGAACLWGVSIVARAETAEKQLRVNEWRLKTFVVPHEEAGAANPPFSNLRAAQHLVDTAVSEKKGEVVEVLPKDLEAQVE
jgi:hypothetical protein